MSKRYRNSEGLQELRYILGKSYSYNPGYIIRDNVRYHNMYPEDEWIFDKDGPDYAIIAQITLRNNKTYTKNKRIY